MCFSAEASFTVGSVLGVIGAVGCKKVKKWPLKLLAIVPLFFAMQQFAEGFVWLFLNGTIENPVIGHAAKYTYLFFGWVFWPLYVPIAFYLIEKEQWRRLVCLFCLALGLITLYVDGMFLLTQDVIAKVVGHSIYYAESPFYAHVLYGTSVMAPVLSSSINRMWYVGAWLLAAFIVAQIIYTVAFTSVWCFFCAAVSILLIKTLITESETCMQQ